MRGQGVESTVIEKRCDRFLTALTVTVTPHPFTILHSTSRSGNLVEIKGFI